MPKHTLRRAPRRLSSVAPGIMLTSMVDMMMVLLVFLIISFTPAEIVPPPNQRLQIPLSTADKQPDLSIKITLSKDQILLDDKEVVPVTDGHVHGALKSGLLIVPLYDALQRHVDIKEKMLRDHADLVKQYKDRVLIVADDKTPASLLDEVFYTVSQRDFEKFVLVVSKKVRETNTPPKV